MMIGRREYQFKNINLKLFDQNDINFYDYSSGTSTTKYFMGNRLSARVIVMNKTKKKLWKWAYLHIYLLLLLYISFKINISRNFKEGFCVRHDICCN